MSIYISRQLATDEIRRNTSLNMRVGLEVGIILVLATVVGAIQVLSILLCLPLGLHVRNLFPEGSHFLSTPISIVN
jgi:hypothetical protein